MAPPRVIFPPHIPGVCHPNVNSMATLIRDLEDDVNNSDLGLDESKVIMDNGTIIGSSNEQDGGDDGSKTNINASSTSNSNGHNANKAKNTNSIKLINQKIQSLEGTSKSSSSSPYEEVRKIGKQCEKFLHQSNLYHIQAERIKLDIQKGNDIKNKYTMGKIAELSSRSELAKLNYKYCIASNSCPSRMNVLNHCYGLYKPDLVKQVFEAGKHGFICKKEKTAVERCVGGLVMNTTRDIC